ncbi:hypothetical protein [Azospirillum argentinense]
MTIGRRVHSESPLPSGERVRVRGMCVAVRPAKAHPPHRPSGPPSPRRGEG